MSPSSSDTRAPRATLLAVAVLLLLPVLLLGNALRPGHVLADAGTARIQPWAASATPAEKAAPQVNQDTVRENLPYRIFLHRTLGKSEIPWWNPYSYCGQPFVALSHTEVLYPPSWVAARFDPYFAYGALILFHLWVAGLGMLAWLRASRFSLPAALFGAVVFALNGMFATRHGHPQFVATACWLPWVLLGVEWLFTRRRARGVALVGGATALAILAGHPSIYVYGFYFVGVWLLVKALWFERAQPVRTRVFAVLAFGAGFAIGVALASPQLFALLELARHSTREERSLDRLVRKLSNWMHLLRIPFWGVLGSPVNDTYWSPTLTTYAAGTVYVGVLPLLLAAVGAGRGGRRGRVLGAVVVVALAILYVPALFRLAYLLPGFKFGRVDRLSIAIYLALAYLAALGLDTTLRDPLPRSGRWRAAALWLLPAAALAVVALAVVPVVSPTLPSKYGVAFLNPADSVPAVIWGLLLWVATVAWLVAARSGVARGALLFVAFGLSLVDLGAFWHHFAVVREADRIFRETPATRFLEAAPRPFRIAKVGGRHGLDDWLLMPANMPMVYGIEDVHGFGPLHTPRLDTLLDAADPERSYNAWHVRPLRDPRAVLSPILDLLGVRYLLAEDPLDLPGYALVHEGDMRIYENPHPMPRAFYVPDWDPAGDDERAANGLASGAYDPRQTVLLSGTPPRVPKRRVTTGDDTVQIAATGLNHVTLRKTGPDLGWVVLADAWYPGWRATVDGKRVRVWRADVDFRAVRVPGGDHEIRFHYVPTWLPWARWLVAFGLLGWLASLVLAARDRVRASARPAAD